MYAVRIHEYGGPEVLKYESDVPDPDVSADSVLIETTAASVNPIDWKVRSGARQADRPLKLPAILGRDVSGIVRIVGHNVPNFKAGDRVIALTDATYAQFAAVEAAIVTHLPDGVDLKDAAAIPLACLTGEQLVRLATGASAGQVILVSGALGSVGRAAVHAAKKLGATVIAGVRSKQLDEARKLEVADVVAIDDETAMAKLPSVDGVADTVGGETAARLFLKIRKEGRFGYASVFPLEAAATNPMVKITRVFARSDPSKLREFADDIRDGHFRLPISQFLPLREAARAHALMEKGGAGKIVLMSE
jgi:NADPH:quinone reductase-like Zn-dependent oxidoreductase